MNENDIRKIIVDSAINIHKEDPGLLETVYEVILTDELRNRGLLPERQVSIPINF